MMKRLYALLLMLSLCWLTLPARADGLGYSKSHPLIIGIDLDYAPLEYVNADGMPCGLDVELTHELMRRMNIHYTYQPNTWENIKDDVMEGRVDLGMMVYSPYRKNILSYSRAIFRLYYQIVYRKDDKSRFDLRNLEGKEIAFMESRPVTDTLTKAGARLNVVTDLSQTLRELNSGRFDAVICFRFQARYHIEKYGLKNLATSDLTLTPREYCYVSLNPQLIDSINVYLEQMDAEGVVSGIYGGISSQFDSFEIPLWVYLLIAVIVIGFLSVNVAFQYSHQRRLRAEMERAQRSERLKNVFLGNVSHALRTPLNGIIGFSDVLLSADFDKAPLEERKKLLRLINQNGHQLLHFIDELLQLSNLESSEIELHLKPYNVADLIERFCDEVRPMLAHGVELRVKGGDFWLPIDPTFMRTLVVHLLRNSAQHTKQGFIEVEYSLGPDESLSLQVTDTGEGLPKRLTDNIFTLLNDANTYIQNDTPGLGLSICKSIVDIFHGKIWAVSEPGHGTTIYTWVPRPLGVKVSTAGNTRNEE